MQSEDWDEDELRMLRALKAPAVGASFGAEVLSRLPSRRLTFPARYRGLVAAVLACNLLLVAALAYVLADSQVPTPQILQYWASAPRGPKPLDGGL